METKTFFLNQFEQADMNGSDAWGSFNQELVVEENYTAAAEELKWVGMEIY